MQHHPPVSVATVGPFHWSGPAADDPRPGGTKTGAEQPGQTADGPDGRPPILSLSAQAFDVLLTADKNMRFQQNLTGRRIALVVLSTPQWPVVRLHVEKIAAAVNAATPGSYLFVEIPHEKLK